MVAYSLCRITKALDSLAQSIPMNQGQTTRVFNTTNLVVQANDISKDSYKGMTFSAKRTSIQLPQTLMSNTEKNSVRVGFIYFANNKFFQEIINQEQNASTPSQQVLSSSVYDMDTSSLSQPVVLRFSKPKQRGMSLNSSCVFWNNDCK